MVFYISEGKKSKIKNIIINGNSNFPFQRFLDKNQISKIFKNTKKFSLLFPWRGKYKKESFEEDLKSLELFYHNNGYKDFKILDKDIAFNKNGINIKIDIFEGEKYYYESINFLDNIKFSDDKLLDILGIEVGEKYNFDKLNYSISENLSSLYMDEIIIISMSVRRLYQKITISYLSILNYKKISKLTLEKYLLKVIIRLKKMLLEEN